MVFSMGSCLSVRAPDRRRAGYLKSPSCPVPMWPRTTPSRFLEPTHRCSMPAFEGSMHPRIALALVCLAGSVVGQASWFSPTLAVNPPPRDTHELATEPISGLVYLFGGVRDHNAGQLNDTWTWDGQAWTQL